MEREPLNLYSPKITPYHMEQAGIKKPVRIVAEIIFTILRIYLAIGILTFFYWATSPPQNERATQIFKVLLSLYNDWIAQSFWFSSFIFVAVFYWVIKTIADFYISGRINKKREAEERKAIEREKPKTEAFFASLHKEDRLAQQQREALIRSTQQENSDSFSHLFDDQKPQ